MSVVLLDVAVPPEPALRSSRSCDEFLLELVPARLRTMAGVVADTTLLRLRRRMLTFVAGVAAAAAFPAREF